MTRYKTFKFGGFGDDLLRGTDRSDLLVGLFGDDTIEAGGGNDRIFAGFGDDVIRAGSGNDRVFAGFGNDTIEGGAGADHVDGGRGIDTAVYAGSVEDFEILEAPGNRITVTNLNDAGDVDTLRRVERLYFEADDYTVDLTGGNNAVLARDDTAAVSAAAPMLLAGLLDNDFDFDGDALTITAVDATGSSGAVSLNDDGTVTYDPQGAFDALAEGETAEVTFTYDVSDGRGSSDTAEVTLTVTGVNDAPVLTAIATASFFENERTVLLASVSDVDAGDSVTFSLSGADAALFEISDDGVLNFRTAPDFETPLDTGGDNIYDVTITATDAGGLFDSEDIVVTVEDVTEAPAFQISEFHYDNAGADVGEFIEVQGAPGFDLTGWSLVLYNGSNGSAYRTIALSGTTNDAGFASVDAVGLQNGAPDGIALVAPDGSVVEFLSYEGELTATDGPAAGLTSTDVGVAEPGTTEIGQSLQRQADGTFAGPATATRDAENLTGDTGGGGDGDGGDGPVATDVQLSEFHYDNAGGDVGEFVEVSGTAGADLTGWSLVFYNGSNGTPYNTVALDGALNDAGFASVDVAGIQNGAPDGIALIAPDGSVSEFISYEGELTATAGPAAGMTSTDIGVSETSGTAIGDSLQRQADGTWAGPQAATRDAANDGGDGGGGGGGGTDPSQSLLISQVQGSGEESPIIDAFVNVTGVVTATLGNGFYLQEEDSDVDADAATSEGIFVFTGGTPSVAVGDVAFAEGTVAEFFGFTQIAASMVETLGTAALPTATTLTLPFAMDVNFEAVEGMLVSVESAPEAEPLTVITNFNFDRFGQLVVSAGEQIQPTQIFDAQTEAAEIDALQAQNDANRLLLEDGRGDQNPESFAYIANTSPGDDGDGILSAGDDLSLGNPAPRIGAELTAPITGVVGFGFGDYFVIPTEALAIDPATNEGAREAEAPDVGGDLTVVSFNALNYFTTLGERGANSEFDLERQTEKLVNALVELDADIVGLQEVENNGFGEGSAIVALTDALNARLGSEVYGVVDPTEDGGRIGTDAITNGLIYKLDEVTVTGSGFLEFEDGGQQRNRPAVAAAFEDADGGVATIAVNHFKSKGPSGLEAGDPTNPDSDQGDGQGFWNAIRTSAADQLTEWLATDPFGTGDPDYLIIGDLNAYSQEDPVQAIEGAGYSNLLEEFVGAEDAFSFVFDGQRGALDHGLATESLASQITGVAEWHINSPEPDLISYNSRFTDAGFYDGTTPFAASDHDPLLIGLTLTPELIGPPEDEFLFV